MEWQAVVIVVQILMLAVGWFLFQQAKGELSARAAETPVLGEVKALQRSIKQLLADLETTSECASQNLEAQCKEARDLAENLANHLEAYEAQQRLAHTVVDYHPSTDLPPLVVVSEPEVYSSRQALAVVQTEAKTNFERINSGNAAPIAEVSAWEKRRAQVFALADAGQPASAIARETGISEGEIETLLGLRLRRA